MKGKINDCGKYIRIGTTLYKTVQRPLISGDYIEEKIPWSYETLRQDYGKNNLPEIEKYDGFCIIPDHVQYKQVHGTYLNQYEPISHLPSPGDFPSIRSFLNHIFGEQIELGLDYLQILYTRPTQMLPILLLVSNERNTGKTTFLRFLKMIFGKNATFNTNEDFWSQFNADWANRLLVLVDELLLNKMEDTEKIKNLSTAGDYKIEAKGKDRRDIDGNIGQLLKTDAKFYAIHVSPSEKELQTMGSTEQEQAEAMKRYIREVFIPEYARNLNKGHQTPYLNDTNNKKQLAITAIYLSGFYWLQVLYITILPQRINGPFLLYRSKSPSFPLKIISPHYQ